MMSSIVSVERGGEVPCHKTRGRRCGVGIGRAGSVFGRILVADHNR